MSRSAPLHRPLQPYSPRRPSPLGLPPLAYHSAFQDVPYSAFAMIPEESEATSDMRFVPESRRPQAGGGPPLAPLTLDTQHHPTVVQQPNKAEADGRRNGSLQPPAMEEMRVPPPPSPTPSSASSLSLYSAESLKKRFSIHEEAEAEEERRKDFSALFGIKSNKPNKILAPREQPSVTPPAPAPAPQMVQSRHRPPPIVIPPISR